uniref:Uncharacterized protein n=2 Tax=Triticum urartu TaxID=4572 RepID=A0A8R7UTD5_TRIUA
MFVEAMWRDGLCSRERIDARGKVSFTQLVQQNLYDTTSFVYSQTNDDDVQAANQNQASATLLVTVGDVFVPSYLRSSFGNELVAIACMHAHTPRKIGLVQLGKGKEVHLEPLHARDFLGNFGWHEAKRLRLRDSNFHGELMYGCNVLGHQMESVNVLGLVMKIKR